MTDALVLCYPVISGGAHRHQGSFDNLIGPDATEEARAEMSLELQVTAETPPTFLWHTVEDAAVPVENSLLFAQALRRHNISFELRIYPQGRHGLAEEDFGRLFGFGQPCFTVHHACYFLC